MTTAPEEPVEGARTFQVAGQKYDEFMGRYSTPLATKFADAAGVRPGTTALDLGCGPGALTTVLVELLGAGAVYACDPSAPFVAECAVRHPGVDVRSGRAEAIPFEDNSVDAVLTQLVLHFVSDPAAAASEVRRVLRPGGTVAACVWDDTEGVEMVSHFWKAAVDLDPHASDAIRTMRLGRQGELAGIFDAAGFTDLTETTVQVSSTYRDFDELWSGFLAGIGPAGAYCVSLDADSRTALRSAMNRSMSSPTGSFTLGAVARCAFGRAPS